MKSGALEPTVVQESDALARNWTAYPADAAGGLPNGGLWSNPNAMHDAPASAGTRNKRTPWP
jgi:hypothetical protein